MPKAVPLGFSGEAEGCHFQSHRAGESDEEEAQLVSQFHGERLAVRFNPDSEIAVATASGGTGHWPVPSGDPPLGTGKAHEFFRASVAIATALPVPSGQWPDSAGESPVLPIPTSEFGVNSASLEGPYPTD